MIREQKSISAKLKRMQIVKMQTKRKELMEVSDGQ